MQRSSAGPFLLLILLVGIVGAGAQIESMGSMAAANPRLHAASVARSLSEKDPESCTDAIDRAVLVQKIIDPPYTESFKYTQNIEGKYDSCFGALLKGQPSQPYKKSDYTCVGRVIEIQEYLQAAIVTSRASGNVPKGTCVVHRKNMRGDAIASLEEKSDAGKTFEKFPTPLVSELNSTQNWYKDQWLVNNDVTPAGWMNNPPSGESPLYKISPTPAWFDLRVIGDYVPSGSTFSDMQFSGPVYDETTGNWKGPNAPPTYSPYGSDANAAAPLLQTAPNLWGQGTVYDDQGNIIYAEPNDISLTQFSIGNPDMFLESIPLEFQPRDEEYLAVDSKGELYSPWYRYPPDWLVGGVYSNSTFNPEAQADARFPESTPTDNSGSFIRYVDGIYHNWAQYLKFQWYNIQSILGF